MAEAIGPTGRNDRKAARRHPGAAISLVLAIAAAAHPVLASRSAADSQICVRAAHEAAAKWSIPTSVMMAITMTETARASPAGPQPWPWAVNSGGRGIWFDSRAEAHAFVTAQLRSGRHNFDAGCFQINHRWHGENFRDAAQMIDPSENADYAARLLKGLFAEFGDWSLAAGAYHSRTPKFARLYRARFDRWHRRFDGTVQPSAPAETRRAPSQDSRAAQSATARAQPKSAGSLVPIGQGAAPLWPARSAWPLR